MNLGMAMIPSETQNTHIDALNPSLQDGTAFEELPKDLQASSRRWTLFHTALAVRVLVECMTKRACP